MARPKSNKENTMEDTNREVVEGELLTPEGYSTSIKVMTADEYRKYSKDNGTVMGRKKGQVIKPNAEEVYMMVKHGYTMEDIMEKYGITENQVNMIVIELSKKTQFTKPFKVPKRQKAIQG